uniref:RNA binding motif protein 18 n=2 Tax=Mus TaxID=862507 RepID=B0R043_MOUSE
METETKTLPLENASILSEGSLQEGHRLWIGNLDPKITEKQNKPSSVSMASWRCLRSWLYDGPTLKSRDMIITRMIRSFPSALSHPQALSLLSLTSVSLQR